MNKLFRCFLFAVATAGLAAPAFAGELSVRIADGRATVIAKDVTLRQILAEWARVGNTRIVNGEKMTGGPITLELVDVPEKDALDILLRTAAGYLTGPRPAGSAGASMYDRVMILATSRPVVNPVSSPPSPFGTRSALPNMPFQPPPDDDDGDPGDQGPMPPPGMAPGTQPFPGPPRGVPFPGATPNPNAGPPNAAPNPNFVPFDPNNPNAPPGANPNAPVTAPRPGMLPQGPQQMPINPYSPMGRQPNPNGRGGQQDQQDQQDQEGAE
jgi:hypothetical protein